MLYASYYARADVGLQGFAKFFLSGADESTETVDGLIHYINMRGGTVSFKDMNTLKIPNSSQVQVSSICQTMPLTRPRTASENDFCKTLAHRSTSSRNTEEKHGKTGIKDALEKELYMNSKLLATVKGTNDKHMKHYLEHHYLEKQVNLIKKYGDLYKRVELFHENQMFSADAAIG